jgi:hypothetical protein
MNKKSDFKNYTRGGQITLHNIRMFMQITNKVALVGAGIFIVLFVVLGWALTTTYERYVFFKYAESNVVVWIDPRATTYFIGPDGSKIKVKVREIPLSPLIDEMKQLASKKLLISFLTALVLTILALWGVTWWLKKRGKKQTENTIVEWRPDFIKRGNGGVD